VSEIYYICGKLNMKIKASYGYYALVFGLFLLTVLFPWRLDLTQDKRFTLHQETKNLLGQLTEPMQIQVFLAGDLPYDYQKLQRSTRQLLEEFQAVSKSKIQFSFVDLYAEKNEQKREKRFEQLVKLGLGFSTQSFETEDGEKQKLIFTSALVSYKNKQKPIQLLEGKFLDQVSVGAVEQAINQLEYRSASAIEKIQQEKTLLIGFTQANGELSEGSTQDVRRSLLDFYAVENVYLSGEVSDTLQLQNLDLLLVANPQNPFSTAQKYSIDQFLMQGKPVALMLSTQHIASDTLKMGKDAWANPKKTDLEDLLFQYGLKLANNLVVDARCAVFQVPNGQNQGMRTFKNASWYFFPVLDRFPKHALTEQLPPILLQYPSSIDFVGDENLQEFQVLLESSPESAAIKTPMSLNYKIADIPLAKLVRQYLPFQPLAVLLEGHLFSAFRNRSKPYTGFQEHTEQGKILLISDGNFMRNAYNENTQEYLPLGFDAIRQEIIYGNKTFMLNAIDYLLGQDNLLALRARKLILRPLDRKQVAEEQQFWNVFHVVFALVWVALLWLGFWWYRRRFFF